MLLNRWIEVCHIYFIEGGPWSIGGRLWGRVCLKFSTYLPRTPTASPLLNRFKNCIAGKTLKTNRKRMGYINRDNPCWTTLLVCSVCNAFNVVCRLNGATVAY